MLLVAVNELIKMTDFPSDRILSLPSLSHHGNCVLCIKNIPNADAKGLEGCSRDLEILPTISPWTPSEFLKCLSGDPDICGWVDGDGSQYPRRGIKSERVISEIVQTKLSLATRAIVAQLHRLILAAVRLTLLDANPFSRLVTTCSARRLALHVVPTAEP